MGNAAGYIALSKKYQSCSDPVRWYFGEMPKLLPKFPYEVTLAYVFLRTEKAHNRALYCGVLKLHRANTEIADGAVNAQHLTREGFIKLYENVFGHPPEKATREKILKAERIRDLVIHGKDVSDPEMRDALYDVLEYAEAMNADLQSVAGFKPFGKLQGFKGAGQALDKTTSRWLLKGLGFSIT